MLGQPDCRGTERRGSDLRTIPRFNRSNADHVLSYADRRDSVCRAVHRDIGGRRTNCGRGVNVASSSINTARIADQRGVIADYQHGLVA